MSSQETLTQNLFRPDCQNWLGYKPCVEQRANNNANCGDCGSFKPTQADGPNIGTIYEPHMLLTAQSIGIAEMGGLGSILRTSAVSYALRKLNPTAKIEWYTHKRGAELLQYVPGVEPIDIESEDPTTAGHVEELDVLINFEINDTARLLCGRAQTTAAFALNQYGTFQPASPEAYKFQRLQIDDEYRADNHENMQNILLESIGLERSTPRFDLDVPIKVQSNAIEILIDAFDGTIPNRLIGLNIGSSEKGKLKRWSPRSFADLSKLLSSRYPDTGIVFLSGPEDEEPRMALPDTAGPNVRVLRSDLEIGQFMAVVRQMNALVTGDTFALHAARAQDVPLVILAGPMPAAEIGIGFNDKIIEPKLKCSPCYYQCKRAVLGECMQLITVEEVSTAVFEILDRHHTIAA